jgi:hypothetical protein
MTPYTAGLKLGEWGATQELAQQVIKNFEADPLCIDAFEPSALRGLYQQAAYIAIISDNEALARTWLKRAAIADISGPPVVSEGDTSGIIELWESIAARVEKGKKGTIRPRNHIWLDGHSLSASEPYQVPIGPHILQYATPRGLVTEHLQLNDGDSLRVGPPKWQYGAIGAGGAMIACSVVTFLGAQYTGAQAFKINDDALGKLSTGLAGAGSVLAAGGFASLAVAALLKPGRKQRAAARKKW